MRSDYWYWNCLHTMSLSSHHIFYSDVRWLCCAGKQRIKIQICRLNQIVLQDLDIVVFILHLLSDKGDRIIVSVWFWLGWMIVGVVPIGWVFVSLISRTLFQSSVENLSSWQLHNFYWQILLPLMGATLLVERSLWGYWPGSSMGYTLWVLLWWFPLLVSIISIFLNFYILTMLLLLKK